MRVGLKCLPLSLSLVFALKALVRPDPASVIGMILWLVFFGLLEFYGKQTTASKELVEAQAREKELSDIKATLQHVTLALGMRGTRLQAGPTQSG